MITRLFQAPKTCNQEALGKPRGQKVPSSPACITAEKSRTMPALVSPAFRRCRDLKALVAAVVQVDPLGFARLQQHEVTRDEQVHDMFVVAIVKAAPPHGLDPQTRRCSGTGIPHGTCLLMCFAALELLFTTPALHLGLPYTSHRPCQQPQDFAPAVTRASIDFGKIASALTRAAREMLHLGACEMNHANVAIRAT